MPETFYAGLDEVETRKLADVLSRIFGEEFGICRESEAKPWHVCLPNELSEERTKNVFYFVMGYCHAKKEE